MDFFYTSRNDILWISNYVPSLSWCCNLFLGPHKKIIIIKKTEKAQNGAVLNNTIFFFPWTREAGEEEDFLPHFSPNFFPEFGAIRRPHFTHLPPPFYPLNGSGQGGQQWPSQHVTLPGFPINTGEGQEKKKRPREGEENRREKRGRRPRKRGEKAVKRKEEAEKKTEKYRGERERRKTAGHREPPAPPPPPLPHQLLSASPPLQVAFPVVFLVQLHLHAERLRSAADED